jgi:UDP-glucose 4-epimerase
MRIVVTGASGFLGSAIVRILSRIGADCIGVSRSGGPGLHIVPDYSQAPLGDCLIHCAETSDRSTANAGGELLEQASRDTLQALLAKGYPRIVYASSAVLYGDRITTHRRTSEKVCITDGYARIKSASELAVLQHGGIVARLTNLYGPGMANGNVVSHILTQVSQDRPVLMHCLEPVRDFLWVDDAAKAFVSMASSRIDGIYNVGSGRGTSIRELVALVQAAAGTDQSVRGRQQLDLPSHLVVDIAPTISAFNWQPETPIEDGIRRLVRPLIETKSKSDER